VAAAEPSFRFDIRPLLSKNCFACHGPDEAHREADLRLDQREAAVDHGAIVPGDVDASELVRRILSTDPDEQMPPPDSGRTLAVKEIDSIKQWIAAGAEYSRHWSYEPPVRPELTQSVDARWTKNPIDHFIYERLAAAGLQPEPETDRRRLIRRASLGLMGLPPTVDEVEAFVQDQQPDAYERLVDRLLASPAFGEHWARMWLDLVRYADTRGYEADMRRTAWPYRDWVIQALNADMPFDQFTAEQIAGDLLEDPTEQQIIATAMHRNTMQNDEGGTDNEEYRVAAVIDRVNTTMQVWMGTTFGCCQCHTHKYDPFAHREYYELLAFFNQTEDADLDDESPTMSRESGDLPFKGMPILRELPLEKRRITHVFTRGSFLSPAEEVSADTPEAFPALPADAPRNRLGLAQWLVDRRNPLTARVLANRLWEQLMGAGLVLTSEDFGSQGALPSHPELLDCLAVELMDHGWSLKHLIKTIAMSATYRQSSIASPEKRERDPENRWLSRGPRHRLSAEQIRDQALTAAGLLSRKMYGPSVMPPQPEGVWAVVYNDDAWKTSEGEDRYRRGLYTFWRRTSPYPSAMALDATSRETCTIRRIRTNTPVAAFALLNDPVYVEAAQALARQIVKHDGSNPRAAVDYGFRRVLARVPTEAEVDRLTALFEQQRERYSQDVGAAKKMATDLLGPAEEGTDLAALAAWTVVSNVLLNLDETLCN
jgi:hypothetical protein